MKTMLKTGIIITLAFAIVAVFALPASSAFAQENTGTTRTVTLTEQQINQSYRVTNPLRRSLSNVSVDTQVGQVVVSATVTFQRTEPAQTVTTLIPTVSNGRVTWSATSAVVNDVELTEQQLQQLNNAIASSWRNFIKSKLGTGRLISLEITDTEIIYTIGPRTSPRPR